jgi:hypothetical protein
MIEDVRRAMTEHLLTTPVPYCPPLAKAALLGTARIERAVRDLMEA